MLGASFTVIILTDMSMTNEGRKVEVVHVLNYQEQNPRITKSSLLEYPGKRWRVGIRVLDLPAA
jgi:hypothetical protein